MITTRACLLSLLAFLVPVPAARIQDAPAPASIVRLADEGSTVELSLDDVRAEDFVRAIQPLLEAPVHYEPAELSVYRIHQPGVQRVARAQLRDAFDGVLRRFDLWTWDDTSGGSVVITVYRLTAGGRGPMRPPFTPRMVTIEELEAGPTPRLPLYTVSFPLQHARARDQLNTLQPLLDTSMEILRPTDPGNQIVITASRDHLLAARDLLRLVDVPGPESLAPDGRLTALEDQLADLAARLAKLEAARR